MRLFEGTQFDRPPRCEVCGELEAACTCPPRPESRTPAAKQIARIAVERRKAKRLVTTVRGLVDEGTHLSDVLTLLKNSCGAGGSIQEGVVELQGDQREKAAATLSAKGYRVKQ